MFLHLSVILFTGGGSASVHAGMPYPPGPDTPRTRHPSIRWLLLRTVRTLLECILVIFSFQISMNAILQPTTVTLMPRVAIHRFLIVVRVIQATLGMDFPVQVMQCLLY